MAHMFVFLAVLVLAVPVTVRDVPTAAAAAQSTAQPSASPPAAATPAGEHPFFSWAYWQEGGTSTSRSEVFRNVGLFFVAVIALGFGIWRAWTAHRQAEASQRQAEAANEQARIAQQGHITDRFSTAVEHLGSEKLPVRLGGIYALWRLIKDSPKRDVISVIDIFCAFVRHPPHEIGQGPDPGASEDGQTSAEKAAEARSTNKIRPDVQTVLNPVGKKNAVYRALLPAGYRLDLTGANLAHANLDRADLSDAGLWQANLTGAYLGRANLAGARLGLANLTGAYLGRSNLMGASLWRTNITDADLADANLTDADLTGTDLTGAENVTQQQLDVARYDPENPPTLPLGLKPPEAPPEPEAEDAAPPPPEA